ncbi:cytochrome P450 [Sporodiniella umbellata]|nr:cytochrome P450 [Sporodiniella umbellata]
MEIQSLFDKVFLATNVFIVALATVFWIKKAMKSLDNLKKAGYKDLPTPKGGFFLIGHLFSIHKKPGVQADKWHKELGPIFCLKMGLQNWVFIGDREAAQNIYVTNGAKSSGRPFSTFNYHIHSQGTRGFAFIDTNKYWKVSRTAFASFFSVSGVDDLYDTIKNEIQNVIDSMIQDFQESPDLGVDPIDYTRMSAINIVLSTMFGTSGVSSVNDKLYKDIVYTVRRHVEWMGVTNDLVSYLPKIPYSDFFFRQKKRMFDFTKNDQHPLYLNLVHKALQSKKHNLIRKIKEIGLVHNIGDEHLVANGIDFMIGGMDAMSSSIAYCISLLCHHEKWQKIIANEIDLFVRENGRFPMFSDREKLPSALAVIKESMRFRSSASFGVSHRVTEDIIYKDHLIPKDSVLVTNAATLNMSDQYYDEPEKFKPERFMSNLQTLHTSSNGPVSNREVFNFGWGRRMCPATYLAECEVFCWMILLLAKYTIEPTIELTGKKVYPNIDDHIDTGTVILPVPFKVRYVERQIQIRV